MPEYYTEDAIVTGKYLFVSYSHEEKTVVRNSVQKLINEGVRLWSDEDLHNGDNWIERAAAMINHENCIGTVFFNSLNSYISDAVAEERRLSLVKKEAWEKEGKSFHVFVVNMGKPSTLRLVKQVFDSVPDNDSVIRRAVSSSQLSVILSLFDDTRIYSYMDADNPEGFLPQLFDDIAKSAPEAVNKNTVALEEMEKLSKKTGISFKMGKFRVNGEPVTLEWQYICCNGDDVGIFLLKQLLDDRFGAGLTEWLNDEFIKTAFSEAERQKIKGGIRLLSMKEAEGLSTKLLQSDRYWWLADTDGARQMVVRDVGSIYEKGSHNNRIQRGVRPVIEMELDTAKNLM